jgi:hypothetical protein
MQTAPTQQAKLLRHKWQNGLFGTAIFISRSQAGHIAETASGLGD